MSKTFVAWASVASYVKCSHFTMMTNAAMIQLAIMLLWRLSICEISRQKLSTVQYAARVASSSPSRGEINREFIHNPLSYSYVPET